MAKKDELQEQVEGTTEVTVKQDYAVTEHKGGLARGLEEVDMKDLMLPMAILVQKASPLLDDPDFEHRAGSLVHSLLFEALTDVKFTPLLIQKSNRFDLPIDDAKAAPIKLQLGLTDESMHNAQKGCVCFAPDGKVGSIYGDCARCGKAEWNGDTAPLCTKRMTVMALFDGYDFPVAIRFHKTSYKHGKKFLSMLAVSGKDIFTRKYKASIKQASDGKNTWYELEIKPAGKVEEDELQTRIDWYEMLMRANVIVEEHEEGASDVTSTEY